MDRTELISLVKQNLGIDFTDDDELIEHYVLAALSYATAFQHMPEDFYEKNPPTERTRQAIVMLATHYYESRDGGAAGFFSPRPENVANIREAVDRLLRLDRTWTI